MNPKRKNGSGGAACVARFAADRRIQVLVALAVTVLVITACGGGGGSGSGQSAQNKAPVLSTVMAQSVDQDTPTDPIAFTVSDDAGADAVALTVSSSDPTVVPPDGITLGGSGGNRTVTVTPMEDAKGMATVSIIATDAQGLTVSTGFAVTVNAVQKSVAEFTAAAFAAAEVDTPVQVSGFTFTQDANDETAFDSLLQ
jgi:hypothetical protein